MKNKHFGFQSSVKATSPGTRPRTPLGTPPRTSRRLLGRLRGRLLGRFLGRFLGPQPTRLPGRPLYASCTPPRAPLGTPPGMPPGIPFWMILSPEAPLVTSTSGFVPFWAPKLSWSRPCLVWYHSGPRGSPFHFPVWFGTSLIHSCSQGFLYRFCTMLYHSGPQGSQGNFPVWFCAMLYHCKA